MTVTELINLLYQMPVEAEVRISTYTGEYEPITEAPVYFSEGISGVSELSSREVNIYGTQDAATVCHCGDMNCEDH